MRVPIYDPEDMELLTVFNLEPWAIEMLGRSGWPILRFPIYRPIEFFDGTNESANSISTWAAEIRFDEIRFKVDRGRTVSTYVGIALNPITCLKLKCDFAPGQWGQIHEREMDAFCHGITAVLGGI